MQEELLYERYPALQVCQKQIKSALDLLLSAYRLGGKVLLAGNGGSAADCEHIVGELMKGFVLPRKVKNEAIPREIREKLQGSLPAVSLPSQCAIFTAYANDVDADMIFAQLVYGYGRKNDLVWGLSTSGNSKNVVYAMQTAKALGLKTLAMTGSGESLLSRICDVTIKVPAEQTYQVQELHLPVYHYLCLEVEKAFFS